MAAIFCLFAGEGGIITDCLSISDITEFSEKIGALAGYVDFSKKNTEIQCNFFVDRGVAGIDRVSHAGIAEPMSYSQFAALTGDFADIVFDFTADGETLAKLKIPYDGSVKVPDIPEIPQKAVFTQDGKILTLKISHSLVCLKRNIFSCSHRSVQTKRANKACHLFLLMETSMTQPLLK